MRIRCVPLFFESVGFIQQCVCFFYDLKGFVHSLRSQHLTNTVNAFACQDGKDGDHATAYQRLMTVTDSFLPHFLGATTH